MSSCKLAAVFTFSAGMRNGKEYAAHQRCTKWGVSLTTADALPDIEDVPSENTSPLELLSLPFGTPEPEGKSLSDPEE